MSTLKIIISVLEATGAVGAVEATIALEATGAAASAIAFGVGIGAGIVAAAAVGYIAYRLWNWWFSGNKLHEQ